MASVLQVGKGWSIEEYLATKKNQLPDDVFAIHLVDLGDREVVGSTELNTEEETIDATGQPWWGMARDMSGTDPDDVAMTDVFQRPSGLTYVAFTSRVSAADRVVVVTLETKTVTDDFQGSVRTEGGFTQVIDGDEPNEETED